MLKVHILSICSHCNGEAYQPIGEAEDCQGRKYIQHAPCPFCEGVVTSLSGSTLKTSLNCCIKQNAHMSTHPCMAIFALLQAMFGTT
jgi:hypothetical protein